MKSPEDIVNLIKSLTGPEKRYFKVFVSKNSIGESNHYLKLFDLIDKTGSSERKEIGKLYDNESFMNNQFRPYKHMLYEQILKSLSAYHAEGSVHDKILEMIRRVEILYDKTLYDQAEKMLEKAKAIAFKFESFALLLEIIRWQKKILSISSSTPQKITEKVINQLVEEEKNIICKIDNSIEYWKLSILMSISFWLKGEVRTQEDIHRLSAIIDSSILKNEELALSYTAKRDLYSIYIIYYGAINNIQGAYEYCKKQMNLINAHPHQIKEEINKYISSLHNLLYSTQCLKKYKEFFDLIPKLKSMSNNVQMGISESMRHKAKLFAYHLEFRAYVITGQFEKATNLLPEIDDALKEPKNKNEAIELFIIINKTMLYYGNGDHRNSLACINTIFNSKNINVLQDHYSLARMFQLLIHFEKGNTDLLPYLVKSVYRYLLQKKQLYKAETILFRFLRTQLNEIKTTKDQVGAFKTLKEELDGICNDPMEAVYLENSYLIPLLESKIKNKPLEEILREKSGFILD